MRYIAAVIIAILIFLGGGYFGYNLKKCDCECSINTVYVPGDTFVFEKPKPTKTYKVVKGNLNTAVLSSEDSADHLPDAGQLVSGPCDSIRVYEYSDSAVTVIDSIHGVLLQQTIIKKPTIREIRTVKKDSLVFQGGFYLGGSAGLNSIRIEAELVDKKGWSYSAGYDLINKSPVIGIKRKLF
jgi:hypothetical protein